MPDTRSTLTPKAFRKASIKDVARRAGVSTTTVSYFVNGRENVCAPETAQRIRTAIADLQYTPNSFMSGLRRGKTRTIGVCLYSPVDPELRYGNLFYERLWRGIVCATDTIDYSLLHYPLSVRDGENSDRFLDGRVDGLLFHRLDSVRAEKVTRAGMPAVMLTRSRNLPDACGTVYADEAQTVHLALNHLFGLGHRRIAHLAGPARPTLSDDTGLTEADDVALARLEAYSHQMSETGCYDAALIGYADSWRDTDNRVAGIVASWKSMPDPPTAILCANDALAVAVIAAAHNLGMDVPGHLSVVGVDDSAEARESAIPLTTVAVPVEEIGREAVRSLLRLLSGEPVEACRNALPVTDIVVRGSTAPCRRNPV
jgi:DNA-binding LacI/PurR family transcriptional regulator